MESTVMETAISQGIWAVLAVFLLIYIVKSNEQRDAKQEEREKNYQTVIENLTEKFQIANYAQTECQFRYCGTAIPFLTVRSTAR